MPNQEYDEYDSDICDEAKRILDKDVSVPELISTVLSGRTITKRYRADKAGNIRLTEIVETISPESANNALISRGILKEATKKREKALARQEIYEDPDAVVIPDADDGVIVRR